MVKIKIAAIDKGRTVGTGVIEADDWDVALQDYAAAQEGLPEGTWIYSQVDLGSDPMTQQARLVI